MKKPTLALIACASLSLAFRSTTGEQLPDIQDVNVVHELADGLEDFQGRVILVEFFAHW